MTTRTTEKKQYDSRHRWRWANRYPLKPGRDLRTRQAVLSQIAETAVSGKYWETQEHLAAKVGLTVRGVQKALDKLCAEGALSRQTRGYKRTTVYTLMRLDEVVEHGDFLPAEEADHQPKEAAQRFPRTGARAVETNRGSSYIVRTIESPTPGETTVETNPGSSRNGLRRTGVRPKKRLREEEKKVLKAKRLNGR